MILSKLFLHSVMRKRECHAEYAPSDFLLKLKKKNMVSNGLASLKFISWITCMETTPLFIFIATFGHLRVLHTCVL